MTGICGYYCLNNHANASSHDLVAMQRCLPPNFQLEEQAVSEGAAISCTAHEHGHLLKDEKLLVVFDGRPYLEQDPTNPVNATQIANLYRQHNESFIKMLGGSFALAVVDLQQSHIMLAVDRMGIKPLAVATINNTIVFGSSAHSVCAHPAVPITVDYQSLYNYVYFHVIPSPRTIYQHIKKLPPAHLAVCKNGELKIRRYWQPQYQRQSRSNLKGSLLPIMRKAVRRATHSTTAGGFLSGGLDSSTVCGLMQENDKQKLNAFTIGFEQEGYDEFEFARVASKHFGLTLNSYYIKPDDVLQSIPEIARAYDEPFGNSSAVPTLVCARLAKNHGVDLLLAGDGGDELFAGNERYSTQKLFSFYDNVPKFIDRSILRPFFSRASVKRKTSGLQHKARRYIEQAIMPMPERMQSYNLLQMLGASTIFNEAFLKMVDMEEPTKVLHAEYWQPDIPDQLERMLFTDYKFTLADNDLRKVNHMCELAGIQVEFPFLDTELVAYTNTIPSSIKLKRFELRSFYKSETNHFLPSKIIHKTKHGFGLPFGEWLKLDRNLSDKVSDNIKSIGRREIFNPLFLADLQDKHQNQHAAYYGNLVWVIAMLEEWLQQHNPTM